MTAGSSVLAPGSDPVAGGAYGPPEPQWPMPVDEFLAGPYLEPADVLLMRQRSSLFARLNRLFTGSFFSKAALVFLVPHREDDFDSPFVIEAAFGGVDLTNMRAFVASRERSYFIAVKRLEESWFELEERHLVRGFMLSHIKAGYDYGKLFDNLWASLRSTGFRFLRIFLGPHWALRQLMKARAKGKGLNKFIGPGFVQWGYYQTAKFLCESKLLPPATLDDIVFSETLRTRKTAGDVAAVAEEDLLGITAEELAKCTRLSWKYAIIDGKVYCTTSEEAFFDLVREGRRLRRANRRAARATA